MAAWPTACALDDWAKQGGKIPKLKFSESGWFLMRAVTDTPGTYRFASTGPYYVEVGYKPRISKASAQFFLDWVNERIAMLKTDDPAYLAAREYWQKMLEKANAN